MSRVWERAVLAYDPDGDSKDGGGIRKLSDRIVKARVGGTCWICASPVEPGTLIRVEAALMDGQMRSCRTCHDCCDAMAKSWTDDGDAIEARYSLGLNAARKAV